MEDEDRQRLLCIIYKSFVIFQFVTFKNLNEFYKKNRPVNVSVLNLCITDC